MGRKILLVDDEPALGQMVAKHLVQAGYEVDTATCCAQALDIFNAVAPDAVLLDIMLPDGDGFSLFGALRRVRPDLPVLFLSARDEDAARLRGLGLGADDYITKPFLLKELELRIAAVFRRVYGSDTVHHLRLGNILVDFDSATVTHDGGREESLTAKEYALLKKLWENSGKIVTIDALCATLWEGELIGYENTLMVHIRRLRKKIEVDPSHPTRLLTVRGLGYKLVVEDRHD